MNKQETHSPEGRGNELDAFLSDGTPQDVRDRYARLAELADRTDFGELDRNVVVVDTEATGFSFVHDELTQIAAARLERGMIVDRFTTFVNPGKPIPDDVVHLTDIHDEDVACAPQPEEALARLVEFVGDAKVVAHNVEFDRTFTTKHPAGYPLLENTWIDSLDLARIAVPRLTSHRLIDLVRAFGAPLSTHRADADVTATCAIYRILLAAVAEMPPALVCRIARMASAEQWSTRVVFAHFAGVYERAARETERRAWEGEGAAGEGEGACSQEDATGSQGGSGARDGSGSQGGAGEAPGASAPTGGEARTGAASSGAVCSGEPRPSAEEPGRKATLEEHAAGISPLELQFSLRNIRRGRVKPLFSARRKEDAEEIARDPKRALVFPSEGEISEAFSASGLVGGLYDDYEPREEQRQMAQAVRESFARSENLMVEAGTGVGKSMAYLVPAALTAQANNVCVGVATKTNALLDQLVYHELPALADALAKNDPGRPPLTFAPLKGFSHYPCLRRIEALADDGPGTRTVAGKEVSQAPALAALLSFVEQSEYDDMDGLKIDYRALPRRSVTTTSRDCLRRKCPFYGASCFVHGSRSRAESADIVVTNHSLLFCDLVADGGLLPPVRYWVVDEAHGTEAEARRAFSVSLEAEEILRVANRVDGLNIAQNLFARAERKLVGVVARAAGAAGVPSEAGEGSGRAFGAGTGVGAGGAQDVSRETPWDGPAEPGCASEPHPASQPAAPTRGAEPHPASQPVASGCAPAPAARGAGPPLEDGLTLFYALMGKARRAGEAYGGAARDFVAGMKDLLYFDDAKRGKGYETVELWINDDIRRSQTFARVAELAHAMAEAAEKLAFACQELVGFLDGIEGAAQAQRDFAVVAGELKDQVNAESVIFERPSDAYAYSATLCRKKDRATEKLEALLVSVGERLNETLYCRTHSVVYASATLTVSGRFDAFEQAVGLNAGEYSAATSRLLESSYDFDNQMVIYVISDMPEPSDPRYLPALQRLLVDVHIAQGGSMLTLFTNRREMEKCFEAVQPELKAADLRLVCQKWGVSVKGLRDDFLKDEHLSLFALKSFWEGFDAPGSTLKGVIIPKLPFSKPSDPLSCERAARDDQAWRHYVLPAAVLETKQAAGRLIRKADDSGVLILADRRLISKSYGKTFLNSLPSRTIRVATAKEVARDLDVWRRCR